VKILGVHPGPLMYTKVFLRLEPLGLELVAAAARAAGHAVRLIDLQVESHTAFFRLVRRWRPEVIAFSCNYLANVPEIVDLAKGAKVLLPDATICVGGHSASFVAKAIIEHGAGAIDCVLRGEGEAGLLPLLAAIEAGGDFATDAAGRAGDDCSTTLIACHGSFLLLLMIDRASVALGVAHHLVDPVLRLVQRSLDRLVSPQHGVDLFPQDINDLLILGNGRPRPQP